MKVQITNEDGVRWYKTGEVYDVWDDLQYHLKDGSSRSIRVKHCEPVPDDTELDEGNYDNVSKHLTDCNCHAREPGIIKQLTCQNCGKVFTTNYDTNLCPKCYEFYTPNPTNKESILTKPDRQPDADPKKLRWSLLPWRELEGVVRAFQDGAKRDGRCVDDWKQMYVDQRAILFDKMMRHLKQYQDGRKVDKDSGLHPLSHLIAMALIAKWFENEPRQSE